MLVFGTACSSSGTDSQSATGSAGSSASSATTPSDSTSAGDANYDATTSGKASAAVLSATKAFLTTLSSAQKTSVTGEWTQANLSQWSNLPDQLFQRAGLRMDTLSSAQQAAVLKILKAALSEEGYEQVTRITYGDGVLKDQGGIDLDFGADHYHVRILGTPSATGKWTLQYGGHHLAVNVTMAGKQMTLAPTFWGAQPASYTKGSSETEPLSGETKKAFALVDSLDATQLKAAVLPTAVTEIVLGAGQDGKTLAAEGVKASTFTAKQKTLLLDLVDEWITPLNEEQAAAKLAAVKKNLADTTFAWYGSTEIGNPIYYRVQGPTFTIEFAHQQGQGANAGGITHIHSIYREPGNDYGAGLTS
ncbi:MULTISPECIES: DUF3500 domain-containing protein [unclassified Streptomyces]|uniref:DUF3500 domain-containing protein n=1 Tax=unclassified Streptomyces TaxID=2593676 RepID=UPI00331F9398